MRSPRRTSFQRRSRSRLRLMLCGAALRWATRRSVSWQATEAKSKASRHACFRYVYSVCSQQSLRHNVAAGNREDGGGKRLRVRDEERMPRPTPSRTRTRKTRMTRTMSMTMSMTMTMTPKKSCQMKRPSGAILRIARSRRRQLPIRGLLSSSARQDNNEQRRNT